MYYINPWVFYIIGLISHIQIACLCVLVGGGTIWFIALLIGADDLDGSHRKVFWKWMKRTPLILLICLGVVVVTPSEATIYKMMIASKISADGVDHVIERLDDVVDSIIESKEQANGTAD